MSDRPKYSRREIERRWLVDPSVLVDLSPLPCREIDDLYLADSRLRLRKISGPSTEITYKLCKKYGRDTPISEPITNLYLTKTEYRRLGELPGVRAVKRRYSLESGSLDVYQKPNEGLAIFELEFDDENSAAEYDPPPFVTREVTGDPAFSGKALAMDLAGTRGDWFDGR